MSNQENSQQAEHSASANVTSGTATLVKAFLGVVLPAACVALLILPISLFGDELPDRVASHFDGSGTPDGSMTPVQLMLWAGLLLVLPGVLLMVGTAFQSRRMPRPWPPFTAGLGAFHGVLGAAIAAETVISQRGNADWTDASGPGLGLVAVLGAAGVVGAGATLLARQLPFNHESSTYAADPDAEVPTMDLAGGERVVFIETISSTWMLWLTAAILAMGVASAVLTIWPSAIFLLATSIPLLLFSAMRVQADQDGMTVRSALAGIRFARIGAEEIEQATVIDVEPMKWGGWGYRGSLKLAGTAAVVLRRGPGIHLKLTGDRVFVVTLDNPRGAAAVLNAHRALSTS